MQSRVVAILVAIVLAVMATMALVVYVHSADRRAISDQQPVLVYVAKAAIPAGTSGKDANNRGWIVPEQFPRSAVVADAVRSLPQITGRVAAVDIVPGEQLLSRRWVDPELAQGQHLLNIPEDYQALSIQVDATRQVSGFITPGDHISIVATFDKNGNSGQNGPFSEFLMQDVTVLAVGPVAQANPAAQGGGRSTNRAQGLTTLTLSVSPKQVPGLVYAAEKGSLYLTLLPPGQKAIQNPGPVGLANVFRD